MKKTIKARFLEGTFKPLEKVELEEGKEVIVIIKEIIKDIYESRRTRAPEVKL
jgi:predicted DNA-binding antitoxin AbrB/MazE fold protein